MQDFSHGNGPGPHAAAHDREGDVTDAFAPARTGQQTHQGGQEGRADHGGRQGDHVARPGLDQQAGLDAQNAAADQGADVKGQEVVGLHEGVDDGLGRGRHDAAVYQQGAAENDNKGPAAQIILDQRQAVADVFQQKAQHHDHGEAAHHAFGQGVQVHGRHDHHADS